MAKELPYFKFFVSEWSDGDITLEEFDTQGLFVNLCAYYWSNNCEITLTKAKKRFRNCRPECFNELIESKIIKLEGDLIVINFLVDQLLEREAKSNQNSINGKKGGRPKKRTESEEKPNAFNSESETKPNQKPLREDKKRKDKKREEEEEEEEQEEEKKIEIIYPFDSDDFKNAWGVWIKYKKDQHKFTYKSKNSEQIALNQLLKLSGGFEKNALEIIEQSIANGYKGLFALKNPQNPQNPETFQERIEDRIDVMQQARALVRFDENGNMID